MGRSALVIDANALQNAVDKIEANGPLSSIGELCEAISKSEFGKSIKNSRRVVKGISAPKAYQAIREYKIVHKTKSGKRGRVAGAAGGTRSTRASKLGGKDAMAKWIAGATSMVSLPEVPERFQGVVQRAATGNVRACVQLACNACVGFQPGAAATCKSERCGLFPLNMLIYPNRKDAIDVGDSMNCKIVPEGSEAALNGTVVSITSGYTYG